METKHNIEMEKRKWSFGLKKKKKKKNGKIVLFCCKELIKPLKNVLCPNDAHTHTNTNTYFYIHTKIRREKDRKI